jgi:predicted amidohydrolase YtcJ
MLIWRSLALSAVLTALGLGGAEPGVQAPDVIYYNGRIVTVNASFDVVEALAVRDGRIMELGPDARIRMLAGPATRLVDLGGETVVPGFHDCHVHPGFGRPDAPWRMDLRTVPDLERLKIALREAAERTPPGQWIVANLAETAFPEALLPTRWDLDEVTPNHPVALPRGPHIWVVNSRALEVAGITSATQQPQGGTIAMNDQGEPNGILRENAAQRIVGQHLPPEPILDDETALRNFRDELRLLVALGITSGNVAGMVPGQPFHWLQTAYDQWGHELPRLTVQLRVRPGFDLYDDMDQAAREVKDDIDAFSVRTGMGNDRLKIGGIKMSVDGGFTGQAAALTVPYPDGRTGDIRIPDGPLYEVARHAHDRGWQLGIHSIGDRGVALAVRILDQVQRENPRPDARHYLHHVSVVPPDETLELMARNRVAVCSQPNFTYDLAPFYASGLRGERLERNNPQQTLIRRGIHVGYGSDHRPYGPIAAIWAAVTREGRDGRIYGADEAVPVEEALRRHTLEAAFLTFDEGNRGSLEPGKYADMVVLTDDILALPPSQIREVGVEQTIIAGEVVYRASGRPLVARFDDGRYWVAGSSEYHRTP